jgi:hypothetical protein
LTFGLSALPLTTPIRMAAAKATRKLLAAERPLVALGGYFSQSRQSVSVIPAFGVKADIPSTNPDVRY